MSTEAPGPASVSCAAAREQAYLGNLTSAGEIIARILREELALDVHRVQVNRDPYSLNSLNGYLHTTNGQAYFFKFHHEEGQEATLRELYQAETLADAEFPVDVPVFASRAVGREILLYAHRSNPRLADVCLDIEAGRADGEASAAVLHAQRGLEQRIAAIYAATLHPITADLSAAEPIHQLFHQRLVGPGEPAQLGGRAAEYYVDKTFALGSVQLSWRELRALHWCINGVAYTDTLGELFERARRRLAPAAMADSGGVVAHGDAHNANVWYDAANGQLTLFDPAFAGRHVPALLAEVKPTFHNIFAHPGWLYHPGEAARRFAVEVDIQNQSLVVETDWCLPALRRDFLAIKAEYLWRPLLANLKSSGCLPADWRHCLRAALFCCPTLVTNLRSDSTAPERDPTTSALGLAIAVMLGSEPARGKADTVTGFLDAIDPDSPTAAPGAKARLAPRTTP